MHNATLARPLHAMNREELISAAQERRWPKWSTMCLLRLLGAPVLNACCIVPDVPSTALQDAIQSLAEATGAHRLMLRSDGGIETRRYYRGGNSFHLDDLVLRAAQLLATRRAVILLEPTIRFTNQLAVLLRMDRPSHGQPGRFIIEALGPGYDVGDLTRGDIAPQVRVILNDVDWSRYTEPSYGPAGPPVKDENGCAVRRRRP